MQSPAAKTNLYFETILYQLYHSMWLRTGRHQQCQLSGLLVLTVMTLIQHLWVPHIWIQCAKNNVWMWREQNLSQIVSDNEEFKVGQGHLLLSMYQV